MRDKQNPRTEIVKRAVATISESSVAAATLEDDPAGQMGNGSTLMHDPLHASIMPLHSQFGANRNDEKLKKKMLR